MTAIALDFGTSNTVICRRDPLSGEARTLELPGLSRTLLGKVPTHIVPSLVYLSQPPVFGEAIRARRLGFVEPHRFCQGFKRDLAAQFRPPARLVDGEAYDAETIAALFLQAIWQEVTQTIGPIEKAIATVPVGAFEVYLDWYRDLAQDLGWPPLQIVDESTAAALGYAVQQMGVPLLVVDFGGGTLDLSLIRTTVRSGDVIRAEIIAKADACVGGIDIDTWIVDRHLRHLGMDREAVGDLGWLNLLEMAERLKINLSRDEVSQESWFDDERFIAHELRLSRAELADILEENQLLEQLRQTLDEVLAIAAGKGVAKHQIEKVLLVGGSCKLAAVQQTLTAYFGKQRVAGDRPFTAVAAGALELDRAIEVADYLRHTYAIRLWDPYSRTYSYYPLFEKGTAYPCTRLEPLILQAASDGQAEIHLDIGEVAEASGVEVTYDAQGRMNSGRLIRREDFRSLVDARRVRPLAGQEVDVCVAHLNPPGRCGEDRIDVRFEVDANRTLLATVKDLQNQTLLVHRQAIAKLR